MITALDAPNSIYDIPNMLYEEGLDDLVVEGFGLEDKVGEANLDDWLEVVDRTINTRHEVTIAMVGKYVEHHDAYKSLTEAIAHGGLRQRIKVNIKRLESDDLADNDLSLLEDVDAILVPGGFGERGFEGKVNAIRYARENGVPYLGICYGMQAAAVEFARNVCGLEGANTTEVDPDTPHRRDRPDHRVAAMLPAKWSNVMKSPIWVEPCAWADRSAAYVRDPWREDFTVRRLLPSVIAIATSSTTTTAIFSRKTACCFPACRWTRLLVEIIEIPDHPWFLACQFHPEFTSSPRDGHPLFSGFIEAALRQQQGEIPKGVAQL